MDEDIGDIKAFDENNIRILFGIISESGKEGLVDWFNEQDFERQEYVIELLGNMVAQLINTKAECCKSLKNEETVLAEVIPFRRKPKLTVIK